MPAGKGRFIIGAKGTHGCDGYPVVGGEGKVHGCHPTREAAIRQQAAIYASQASEAKKSAEATWTGFFYTDLNKQDSASPKVKEDQEDKEETKKSYQGCGCETCKELNVDCPDCPKCGQDMGKADMPASCNCNDCGPNCDCGDCKDCSSEGMTTEKKDYPAKARERMASEGHAMPDGSFPIANEKDLRNAIQSVGRAKDYNAAKQHIMRRARALGLVDLLPEDWKKGVRKTEWGGSIFDLNPFVK